MAGFRRGVTLSLFDTKRRKAISAEVSWQVQLDGQVLSTHQSSNTDSWLRDKSGWSRCQLFGRAAEKKRIMQMLQKKNE